MNQPIACSLDAPDRETRRDRWVGLGSRALVEIEPTSTGLRLVFTAGPGVADELQELAELERECCAFASWTVEADADRVVLDVAGEAEAVPVVQGMFGPLREVLTE